MILELTFIIAISGHGADLASTENCLGAKRCTEMNRFLGRFNQPAAFGAVKMGVVGISEYGIYKLSKNHPKLAGIVNLTIAATFTGIAIRNSRISK